MSKWTYVDGVIRLETMARSTPEALYMAQTVVNHLPRVTGSEGDVQIYVNIARGHNCSSNADEFNQFTNLYTDPQFRSFETQSQIILTIQGALRDREFGQTMRETVRMLKCLGQRLTIDRCLLSINGYDRNCDAHKCVIDDPKWLTDMDLSTWAYDLLWNWADDEEGPAPSDVDTCVRQPGNAGKEGD